ncbi:hypothetical protein SODALDRAFT_320757 [Sodiomyces alkalinus F11]|uniref:MEI5 protein n=1 Tax=Sodiomyces alkalinus (strain CBS 110278 / VKM F-3762 / F11) TaxID=1314773 RepID=A0A3N2PLZ3_SODAK|nr:hypothetical protein SODALDRAFT_320757 [Sodiomyces alkalinus F11]ROT35424.1 hypothetical protein SODALDRAFT_320757 [Sodiomyces alkalinus F11]
MSPADNHTPRKADPSPSPGPEHVIDEFISVVNKLSSDKSFQGMKDIALHNNKLRKELDETTTAYNRNLGELTRLTVDRHAEKARFEKTIQEQAKQHIKATEEKAAAYRKLKGEQDTATGLREKIKALENDVKRSIATVKSHEDHAAKLVKTVTTQEEKLDLASKEISKLQKDLQSANNKLKSQSEALMTAQNELASFRSCTATLTHLRVVRPKISQMLAMTFNEATDLFRAFLGHDMGEDQLQNPRCWDRIRDHAAIQRAIPLPASNSAPAKRMRVIAGLSIYARALASFVLQPTYLSLGTGADNMLDMLPGANLYQDELVRSVLLAVLPDQQKTRRDECADLAVEEVVAAVAGIVPAEQHAPFKLKLSHLTGELCSNWQLVQRLKERVGPCFALENLDDWQPLPRWPGPSPSGNSTKSTPPRQGGKESQPKRPESEPATFSVGDVVKVVWPAFVDVTADQAEDGEENPSDLIHHGYMLTRGDAQDAANEEMPRRAMRRTVRDGNAVAQRRRRDSAVFLSQGASDGSAGK